MNDVIMILQKLKLLPKGFGMHEASIERKVASGSTGRKHAVVIYDRISGGGCNAVEASGVM
jgi:hypothetical protein